MPEAIATLISAGLTALLLLIVADWLFKQDPL